MRERYHGDSCELERARTNRAHSALPPTPDRATAGYTPRSPEQTLLHRIVGEQLEPLLSRARETGQPALVHRPPVRLPPAQTPTAQSATDPSPRHPVEITMTRNGLTPIQVNLTECAFLIGHCRVGQKCSFFYLLTLACSSRPDTARSPKTPPDKALQPTPKRRP